MGASGIKKEKICNVTGICTCNGMHWTMNENLFHTFPDDTKIVLLRSVFLQLSVFP